MKCQSHSCSVKDAVAVADDPVLMCETRTLPPVLSLPHARNTLLAAVQDLHTNPPRLPSGIVRFQVCNCNPICYVSPNHTIPFHFGYNQVWTIQAILDGEQCVYTNAM